MKKVVLGDDGKVTEFILFFVFRAMSRYFACRVSEI